MRLVALAVLLTLLARFGNQAGEKDKIVQRFGVDLEVRKYPQDSPKAALGSVIKAVAEKRFDYLLAHLADPAFIEQRLKQNMAALDKELPDAQKLSLAFDRLAKTTGDSFLEDPSKLTDLRRFHEEGEWEELGEGAVASLKGLQSRKVYMHKVASDRWVLLDKAR